jgi:geranylgeranyl pyrophosphate synthase
MTTRAAAMISPVDEAVVEVMKGFGYNLGMAFQIVDDVLDFTGEQQEVGKPVGSDLLQGLITLPALYYIEDNPQDPGVLALLGGRALLEREKIETLVLAIRASDGIRKALKEGKEFVKKAVEFIASFPPSDERQALEDLAEYVVNRKK